MVVYFLPKREQKTHKKKEGVGGKQKLGSINYKKLASYIMI